MIQHLDNHLNTVNIIAFQTMVHQKLIIHKFDPTAAVRT